MRRLPFAAQAGKHVYRMRMHAHAGMGLQPGQVAPLLEGAQRQMHAGNASIIAANPWIVDGVTAEAARANTHQVSTIHTHGLRLL